MSQQFSNTGIQDGLPVEANEVSQSVEAFTGIKAYDIITSGSLTISGSTPSAATPGTIRFTGSLINDGPGQFSHVGISTPAQTAGAVGLVVLSDTVGGFDPIVSIEGDSGTDIPQLQFVNEDINWTARIGQPNDDFQILQSGSVNKYPFIIDKNQSDYTLYTAKTFSGKPGSIGIKLGINTPTLMQNMQYGSSFGELRALRTVSGSLLKAANISASLSSGINIHGTASYTNYIETAQSASYTKAKTGNGSIDFSYNINSSTSPNNNSQINAQRLSEVKTGSIPHITLDANNVTTLPNFGEGLYIQVTGEQPNVVISGSNENDQGTAWIGNPDSQYIKINQLENKMSFGSEMANVLGSNSTTIFAKDVVGAGFLNDDTFVEGNVTVSGSTSPTVTMDGFDPGDFVIFASMSFEPNDLKFDVNNAGGTTDNVARVANMNTGFKSKLSLSAGGGGSNTQFTALSISSSSDTELITGSMNWGNITAPTRDSSNFARNIHAYKSYGRVHDAGDGNAMADGWEGFYKPPSLTYSGGDSKKIIQFFPTQLTDPTNLGDETKYFQVEIEAVGMPANGNGVYLFQRLGFKYVKSSDSILQVLTGGLYPIPTRITADPINYGFSNIFGSPPSKGTVNNISILINQYTSQTTFWEFWVNIKCPGTKFSAL